ncbi:hypothetical protein RchiOBHm_Chr4g0399491 [Rosa chinensis]|uniref:Uncharacterized protein n=1 Tax=Rosa chinensis TaxID=74649 RepID=A0A2P6QSK6_ROSCH|nr:hypothetical protein RchiOBHm_Chr4g0399491 [Rosa chinensis]
MFRGTWLAVDLLSGDLSGGSLALMPSGGENSADWEWSLLVFSGRSLGKR